MNAHDIGPATSLERTILVGWQAFPRLSDALALYREVTIVLDDNYEIKYFVSQFGPDNLVSFLDEFHENVHIHVFRESSFHGSGWGKHQSDYVYTYHDGMNNNLAFDRSLGRGLAYLPGPDNPTYDDVWVGPGAKETIQRFEWSFFPAERFFKLIGENEELLANRYMAYLAAIGIRPSSVEVSIDSVDTSGLRGVQILDEAGNSLERDFLDFLYASADEFKIASLSEDAHIIVRHPASHLLSHDAGRIAAMIQSEVTREVIVSNLIPGMRSLTDTGKSLKDHFAQLGQIRRIRLNLPVEISALDIADELRRVPWYDRLPNRIGRWTLFTGAGVVADLAGAGGLGTVSGVAIAALDEFLLNRILAGWRPSQFQRFEREMRRLTKSPRRLQRFQKGR